MNVVIPKPGSTWRTWIIKGSGIVMLSPNKSGVSLIYYEGNMYNAPNLNSYEERIKCAAGRAHTQYPTIAFHGVLEKSLKDFVVVGSCYPEHGYKVELDFTKPDIIKEWIE